MPILRADARRGCTPRISRSSARRPSVTRTRALLPVAAAPIAIVLTAIVAGLFGLSPLGVVAITAAVAIAGAAVAHRTVGSVLSGLILLLARPYAPGDRLRLHVPELGEPAEVEVLRIGLVTTTVCTGAGVLVLPNDRLLRPPR